MEQITRFHFKYCLINLLSYIFSISPVLIFCCNLGASDADDLSSDENEELGQTIIHCTPTTGEVEVS